MLLLATVHQLIRPWAFLLRFVLFILFVCFCTVSRYYYYYYLSHLFCSLIKECSVRVVHKERKELFFFISF